MKSTKQVGLHNFMTPKTREVQEFKIEKSTLKTIKNNKTIINIKERLPLTKKPFQVRILFSITDNVSEVIISGNENVIVKEKLAQESKEQLRSKNFSFNDDHFKGISEISSVYNFYNDKKNLKKID